MLRVIAGSARGTRLRVPDKGVRPTADRAREALMSALGGFFSGERVLDVCAGSGAVGIELLSRGCGHAVLIESDPGALRALRHNLDRSGTAPRAELRAGPALGVLRRLRAEGRRFDIAFVDPPYASGLQGELVGAIIGSGLLAPGGEVVLEQARDAEPPPLPAAWELFWWRRYGAARMLRIARSRTGSEPPP